MDGHDRSSGPLHSSGVPPLPVLQETLGLSVFIRNKMGSRQTMGMAPTHGLERLVKRRPAARAREEEGLGESHQTQTQGEDKSFLKKKEKWSMKRARENEVDILQGTKDPTGNLVDIFGEESPTFPFPPEPALNFLAETEALSAPFWKQDEVSNLNSVRAETEGNNRGDTPMDWNSPLKPIKRVIQATASSFSSTVKLAWDAWSPNKKPQVSNWDPPPLKLENKRIVTKVWKGIPKKRRGKNALSEALKPADRERVLKEFENEFSAAPSKKSKSAVRATVEKVLLAATKDKAVLPANPEKSKLLGGILKESDYKAGSNYLTEYKLMVIESGQTWTDILDRVFKLCKRALDRNKGPRKKAAEVKTVEDQNNFSVNVKPLSEKPKVPLAFELFEFGVVWMLREIELSNVLLEHIAFDPAKKRVTLQLPHSKMDQQGEGVSRVLQCLCEDRCLRSCPMKVTLNLLEGTKAWNFDRPCSTTQGKQATKAQLVKEWKNMFGAQVTGHSARRTGALRYIRLRWPLAQVAYLGRWKSSVIYDYAAEALESLPVNNNPSFDPKLDTTKGGATVYVPDDEENRVEEVRNYLTAELAALRLDQKKALETVESEIENLKARQLKKGDRLPPYVQSIASKITHSNLDLPNCSPPFCWRTRCGWSYYKSDYVFLEDRGTSVLCKKCEEPALSMEGKDAGSLSSRMEG